MSDRYQDLLILAVGQCARAESIHAQALTDSDIQGFASAADSFRAAATFYRSALAELDPTITTD